MDKKKKFQKRNGTNYCLFGQNKTVDYNEEILLYCADRRKEQF